MAYAFEELANWWPGKSYPVAYTKLVVTQEDGRTAFGDGIINNFNAATNDFSGQFAQQFNDRTRQINYGPPSLAGGSYAQNFDMNSGIDLADFLFVQLGPNDFELRLTLLRWGNAQMNVRMTAVPEAKLYLGWGETIGHGSGQALYVVSINDVVETPG